MFKIDAWRFDGFNYVCFIAGCEAEQRLGYIDSTTQTQSSGTEDSDTALPICRQRKLPMPLWAVLTAGAFTNDKVLFLAPQRMPPNISS